MKGKLYQLETKLDHVFSLAKTVDNDEFMSNYAKYLCILVSGYLENSIKIIINNYAGNSSSPIISNYIQTQIKNITNLKDSKIQNLLEDFNANWKEQYLLLLTDEQKDALDSIVANRNLIAHGQSVGITYIRVLNYYQEIKKVIKSMIVIIK